MIKKVFKHLGTNWIKYGFETVAIIVGILGAVTLDNWNSRRLEEQDEIEYLSNLKVDLESQLEIIVIQKDFEEAMGSVCEDILETIHEPPYDVDRLNELATSLGRKTFVVRNAVYEDLKYSGNLDIISNEDLRNALLNFYQHITRAESVFANNNQAIHQLGNLLMENGLADFGFSKDLNFPVGYDISIDIKPFRNAEKIITSQLENDLLRFVFHNRLVFRGRLSSIHVYLLEDLVEENKLLIGQLEDLLASKK